MDACALYSVPSMNEHENKNPAKETFIFWFVLIIIYTIIVIICTNNLSTAKTVFPAKIKTLNIQKPFLLVSFKNRFNVGLEGGMGGGGRRKCCVRENSQSLAWTAESSVWKRCICLFYK